jgi:hypothetical protein
MASQAASSWVSEQVLDFQNAKLNPDALAIAPLGRAGISGAAARQRAKIRRAAELHRAESRLLVSSALILALLY